MGAKVNKNQKICKSFCFFFCKNMIMKVTCYPISRRINGY